MSVEKSSEFDGRLRSAGFDDSYTKWADRRGSCALQLHDGTESVLVKMH